MLFRSTFFVLFLYLLCEFNAFASTALSYIPDQRYWSLATDDIIKYNTVTDAANAEVYLSAVDGTLYRTIATTTGSRILTAAKTVVRGSGGLGAAMLAAQLIYDGYQWYKETDTTGLLPLGYCGDFSYDKVTLSDCMTAITKKLGSIMVNDVYGKQIHGYSGISLTTKKMGTVTLKTLLGDKQFDVTDITVAYSYYSSGVWYKSTTDVLFNPSDYKSTTQKDHTPITETEAKTQLMSQLINLSSRDAFSDGSQPYPVAGLFTNSDLAVDPTYQSNANINTQNINDYITKYNNGLLQTTDPSAPNYVTPAQYAYIKSQAEQAVATAANPTKPTSSANNTNPLTNMEQPITQDQYDTSNKKVDDAAKSAVNSQSFDGFGDNKTLDDGNQKLKEISEGGIQPLTPFNLPSLPQASSCVSVTWQFMGQSLQIPGPDGCQRLADLKRIFGYLLYVLTAIAIIWKATEKPLE